MFAKPLFKQKQTPKSLLKKEFFSYPAIVGKNFSMTYGELAKISTRTPPFFLAKNDLSTVLQIWSHVQNRRFFMPLSPKEPIPQVQKSFHPDAISAIKTSGTTSEPKCAMHSLENHIISAQNPLPDLKLQPGDRWYLSLPLYHIGGLTILFRVFLSGACIVLPDLPETYATHISFVPTQLKRFLQKKLRCPKLKAILLGGAPIPQTLCEKAKDLPLYLTYGMTEMSSQIATKRYSGNVCFGVPLKHRRVLMRNKQIFVQGKTRFLGYQHQLCTEKWFCTNDLGEWKKDGLYIFGRKDRCIISGGENIFLDDVEKALLSIPEVTQVKVFSRKDPEFGERPVAKVFLDKKLSKESIQKMCRDSIAKFAVPYEKDLFLF